jgi:hypothetical protein
MSGNRPRSSFRPSVVSATPVDVDPVLVVPALEVETVGSVVVVGSATVVVVGTVPDVDASSVAVGELQLQTPRRQAIRKRIPEGYQQKSSSDPSPQS